MFQAALHDSKSFLKIVKAHEVCAVATPLQLFSKVDLQTCTESRETDEQGNTCFILLARPLSPSEPTKQGWILGGGHLFLFSES